MSTKSYTPKASEIERRWYVIDADGKTLGRLCSAVARVLMGKHKPTYAAHLDSGDFVIVVNANKVVVSGRKAEQKLYRRHTGYPGGLKEVTYEQMMDRKPAEILRKAVYGMMPKTRLARQQFRKLKIYAGPEHPHEAQTPEPYEVR